VIQYFLPDQLTQLRQLILSNLYCLLNPENLNYLVNQNYLEALEFHSPQKLQ